MNIPKCLWRLAKLFAADSPLYLVGGFVRNSLLGYEVGDLDICSAALPDQVEAFLENSDFVIKKQCKRLGTLIIKGGETEFEYTSFRTDSYPQNSGSHTPNNVVFTNDILLDARRRDFSVNAIYYDILADKIIDPLGCGITDLGNKILRTADSPMTTLGQDALRIMRMVRLGAELGFEIDTKCFEVAKNLANTVCDISKERQLAELEKILISDTKYLKVSHMYPHFRGVTLLEQLGVLDIIIPEFKSMRGLCQNPKFHKFDVLTHSILTMKYAPPHLRLCALLHDIGKPEALRRDGKMYLHDQIGRGIVKEVLGCTGLRCSGAIVSKISQLISLHMLNKDGQMGDIKIRRMVAENYQLIPDLIALQKADKLASGMEEDAISIVKISQQYDLLADFPKEISQLLVDGDDAIEAGLSGKKINEGLKALLGYLIDNLETLSHNQQRNWLFKWATQNN